MTDEAKKAALAAALEKEAEYGRRADVATANGAVAFERLLTLAETQASGQVRRVARIIAGLFNGQDFPIDPYELRGLDVALSDDVLTCLDALRWGRRDLHSMVPNGEGRVLAVLKAHGLYSPE